MFWSCRFGPALPSSLLPPNVNSTSADTVTTSQRPGLGRFSLAAFRLCASSRPICSRGRGGVDRADTPYSRSHLRRSPSPEGLSDCGRTAPASPTARVGCPAFPPSPAWSFLPVPEAARPCIPHCAGDHGRRQDSSVSQRAVVEMGVDCRGLALAVSEQPTDRGEPDAVHDALRGPRVAAVVDAEAEQPSFLSDADPERVEPIRCEVLGENPRPRIGASLRAVLALPAGARPCAARSWSLRAALSRRLHPAVRSRPT